MMGATMDEPIPSCLLLVLAGVVSIAVFGQVLALSQRFLCLLVCSHDFPHGPHTVTSTLPVAGRQSYF
jgi:hypothetical protein